jgi:predicted metal-binding protein
MSGEQVDLFVCVSCNAGAADDAPRPAQDFVSALQARLAAAGAEGISAKGIECLAVCKRPCTLALTSAAKWTYIIGDLDPATHTGDVVAMALAFQRSPNGIVPWAERPAPFRKGVIARVPPLGFVQPEPESP